MDSYGNESIVDREELTDSREPECESSQYVLHDVLNCIKLT